MPLPPGQPERRAGRVDEAMANTQRLTRLIKIVGIVLAGYVAIAVTVASIFGVLNATQSSKNARLGATYARQALEQARVNGDIAADVRDLVKASGPCLPNDPPDSLGCVREARTATAVNSVIKAIEMHDMNDRAAHELLAQVRRSTTTMPPRTSVTTRPRTTTTIRRVATTTTRPPPTTTTTCPKRGNTNKCR